MTNIFFTVIIQEKKGGKQKMFKDLFKSVGWNEDIQLNTKSYYNVIKAGSIAWNVVRVAQVLVLFTAVMLPYLVAIIVASCLGF